MATQQVTPFVVPAQISIPSSFQHALKLGWKLVKEDSTIDDGERERKGVVLLRKYGVPFRLRISYTATRKEWKFDRPEVIQ